MGVLMALAITEKDSNRAVDSNHAIDTAVYAA